MFGSSRPTEMAGLGATVASLTNIQRATRPQHLLSRYLLGALWASRAIRVDSCESVAITGSAQRDAHKPSVRVNSASKASRAVRAR